LQPNYANTIRNALENMEPRERVEAYIEMIATHPMNAHDAEDLQIFKDIFRELYPHDLAAAEAAVYATPSWANTTNADFTRNSIHDLLMHGPKGGKTRRNRNRRRRGRGRRSLKHYSKRR
jgi:hypothetical protein